MIDYTNAQLNNSIQVKNKKDQDRFTRIFGSLSSSVLDFIRSENYDELKEAIYIFYIQESYETLEKSTALTMDLKNPETLAKLHDVKQKVLGMMHLYEELSKMKEAIKDLRLI